MTGRVLDHSGLDSRNACVSCGVNLTEHLGLVGTCNILHEHKLILDQILQGHYRTSEDSAFVKIPLKTFFTAQELINEESCTQKKR